MGSKEVGQLKATVSLTTAEFNKGVETLSKQMSVVRQEFKNASGNLDKVKDSMQIAALKTESLTKQIDIQKKIVAQMSEAHKYAAERFGEGSKQAVNYELKLKKSEGTLQGLEKALKSANAEMKNQTLISADTQKKIEQVGKSFEEAGKKMTSIGKNLSMTVTAPLALIGKASLDLAMDAVESENLFEVSMGSMAGSAREFSEQLRDDLGLNAYEVRKNVATINDMTHSMGLSATESYKISTGMTKLAYDLASFKNLKPEEAFEKLTAGITGEAEPLKRIGILVNENTIKTYAYKNGIAAQGEVLTEQQKVLARYGTIIEQTANAQGDLARTIDSPTNKARIQGERFKQISTDIGNILIPMYDKVLDKLEDLTKWFDGLSQSQKENIVKIAAIAAAAGPLLIVFGSLTSAIGSLLTGVKALNTAFVFLTANPIVLGIAAIAAAIGVIVYQATSANREAARMADTLIEGYKKEVQAQKKAIDKKYSYRFETLNKELSDEQNASNERISLLDKEYEEEIKAAGKKESAMKKSLQERKSALDKSHNEEIQRIRDEYGVFEEKSKSKTDIVLQGAEDRKKALDDEVKAAEKAASDQEEAYRELYENTIKEAEKAHEEKVKMLDDEYVRSIRLVDEELAEKIKAFQDEINGINQKTEEENRIIEEQRNNEKIADLQKKVDDALSDEERKIAQKALSDEINRINREKEIENRKIQIESLKDQIDQAKTDAEERKNALKETLDNKKTKLDEDLVNIKIKAKDELDAYTKNEGDKLTALKTRVESEKIEIDAKAKEEIRLIQQERLEKETAENKKYESAKLNLDNEESALDGFAERYKEKLEAQLAEKKRIEAEKLQATQDRINDEIKLEQDKVVAEKAKVDETSGLKIATAKLRSLEAELKKLMEIPWWKKTGQDSLKIISVNSEIEKEKKELHNAGVPGFAEGVTNWRGGLARINEKGGEIVNLPSGANVIPHDISMQIAKAVGAAVSTERIDYKRLGAAVYDAMYEAMKEFPMPKADIIMDGARMGRAMWSRIEQEKQRLGVETT